MTDPAPEDADAAEGAAQGWAAAVREYPTEHVGYDQPVPSTCTCDECYRREDQRNAYVAGFRAALAAARAGGGGATEWGVLYPDDVIPHQHDRRETAVSYAREHNELTDGGAKVVTREVTPWVEAH